MSGSGNANKKNAFDNLTLKVLENRCVDSDVCHKLGLLSAKSIMILFEIFYLAKNFCFSFGDTREKRYKGPFFRPLRIRYCHTKGVISSMIKNMCISMKHLMQGFVSTKA